MRPLASLGPTVGTLCALWAFATVPALAQSTRLPDNPLAGRLLFEDKHCHQCHGIDGSGPGIGPDLGADRFRGSFLDLGAALWNHVPGMGVAVEESGVGWPRLTPEETTELTAFLYFIDYLGRPGDGPAGGELYREKGCAACHTVGGGGSGVGPDLTQLQRFASPLYTAQAIWNHGPSMFETMRAMGVRTPTFAEGDLADLSAFIRRQADSGPRERMLLAPGNPNRGRELFQDKGCSTCHGDDARGGDGGPDLREAGLHRSAEAIAGTMWNHALAMKSVMERRGIGWPRFTTPELADVVAFLYFLPFEDPSGDPTRGERVFASHSCAECHGPDARSDHEGPKLVGSEATSAPSQLVAAMWNHAPVMSEAILAEGRPWPQLTGEDLRDLLAHLTREAPRSTTELAEQMR